MQWSRLQGSDGAALSSLYVCTGQTADLSDELQKMGNEMQKNGHVHGGWLAAGSGNIGIFPIQEQ
jgi:hypothetical protein